MFGLVNTTFIPTTLADIELPGIVVIGSSLDDNAIKSNQVGSSVSVITAKEIEQQQIRHVADALRNLPGVSVNRTGSSASVTQVRLRGAEGNHTLVLIDGVQANSSTDGEFDFSDLSTGDIERIEVIRGPQSGLYGSNALGGVINIITKKGRGPLKVTLKGEAGSFDTASGSVNISGGNERLYGSFTIDRYKTDGFNISPSGSEDDGSERTSFFFRGGFRPLENLTIDFMLRNVNKDGDRDDPNGDSIQEDTNSIFSTDLFMAGLSAKLETLDGKWTHKLSANKQKTDRFDQSSSFTSFNDSEAINLSYLNTWKLSSDSIANADHFITSLVEYRDESFAPKSSFVSDQSERSKKRVSYVLEYRGEIGKHLSLSAAIRYDDSDTFEDFTTYRFTGSWQIPNSQFRIHSNVGTGVVLPSLFDQFGLIPDFFVGNENLKPEESFGWDAGIEWSSIDRKYVIDITYFNQNLENEIIFAPFVFGEPSLTNEDGRSERQGIEVQLTGKLTPSLSLTGGYTYLDANGPDGSDEVRRPKHSGKLNVNYAFSEGKGNLNLGVNYNGKAKDGIFTSAGPETVTLDDYVHVSLAGSYKLQPNIELFGRVENLLDEDYQEVFGFETAGVSAYAGVKVKLGQDHAQ